MSCYNDLGNCGVPKADIRGGWAGGGASMPPCRYPDICMHWAQVLQTTLQLHAHTCGRERGWEWGLRTEGAPGSAKHAVPAGSGSCHGGAPAGNPSAVGQPQSGSAPAVLDNLEQRSSLALVASSSMPWGWLLRLPCA